MSDSKKQHLDSGWPALITAVFVLSVGSTVSKKSGVPGLTMACIRSFIACIVWQIILAFRGRHLTLRGLMNAALPGMAFGTNIACFFTAAQHTHVANIEFLGALGPLVIVPTGAFFYRERLPWRALVFAGPAIGGVALVALTASRTKGSSNTFGLMMGVLSVFTWATYLLLSKRFRPRMDIGEFMAGSSLFAGLITLPGSLHQGFLHVVPARGWPWLLLLTLSNGVIAHTLILVAQRSLALGTISTMQVAQPALAAAAAWILLGESIRPVQFIGMAVVLASLLCYTLTVQRQAFPWQASRRPAR